jgi:hypothetical protein
VKRVGVIRDCLFRSLSANQISFQILNNFRKLSSAPIGSFPQVHAQAVAKSAER